MRRMNPITVLASVFVLAAGVGVSSVALAHGGGTDSNGGHNDRKNGGYHFHRGPLAGRSFATKAEALAALDAYYKSQDDKSDKKDEPAKPASERTKEPTTQEWVDAMRAVLIEKSLVTEKELRDQVDLARGGKRVR